MAVHLCLHSEFCDPLWSLAKTLEAETSRLLSFSEAPNIVEREKLKNGIIKLGFTLTNERLYQIPAWCQNSKFQGLCECEAQAKWPSSTRPRYHQLCGCQPYYRILLMSQSAPTLPVTVPFPSLPRNVYCSVLAFPDLHSVPSNSSSTSSPRCHLSFESICSPSKQPSLIN